MLLFELFPAFMALLSIPVGIWLYRVERRARRDPERHRGPRADSTPAVPDDYQPPAPSSTRRPSMRA